MTVSEEGEKERNPGKKKRKNGAIFCFDVRKEESGGKEEKTTDEYENIMLLAL